MYLEFEKKGLLTRESYEKIISTNKIFKETTQINYYFETGDNYFKNNNSALRVRVVDNTYELTLKVRRDVGNVEYNHIIDHATFTNLIENFIIPKVLFDYIDVDVKIDNVIHFTTKRSVIPFEEHSIEMDMTDFGKKIDYEIEVEGENMKIASKVFNDFIFNNNITYEESMPKIARYYKYNN